MPRGLGLLVLIFGYVVCDSGYAACLGTPESENTYVDSKHSSFPVHDTDDYSPGVWLQEPETRQGYSRDHEVSKQVA